MSIPYSFVLTNVRAHVWLTHTYVGDLTLKLRHCGTSVVLYDRSPGSSSDLSGWYAFDDQASAARRVVELAPGGIPKASATAGAASGARPSCCDPLSRPNLALPPGYPACRRG